MRKNNETANAVAGISLIILIAVIIFTGNTPISTQLKSYLMNNIVNPIGVGLIVGVIVITIVWLVLSHSSDGGTV